jgi:hypothetical protein
VATHREAEAEVQVLPVPQERQPPVVTVVLVPHHQFPVHQLIMPVEEVVVNLQTQVQEAWVEAEMPLLAE